jgi:hypothetical protein
MLKKMMLLAVAAGALVAFAAPTVAQATELKEGKTKLAVGAKVTATSTNLVTTTAAGKLACALVTIHGNVTENGPSAVIEPTSTTTSECHLITASNGVTHAVTITDPTVGTIKLTGGGASSATATFIADIPTLGVECHFAGTVAFTYVSKSDTFSIPGSILTGSGATCPVSEGTIEGSFTLETSTGTPVEIVD